jgi:hypothetical protein
LTLSWINVTRRDESTLPGVVTEAFAAAIERRPQAAAQSA